MSVEDDMFARAFQSGAKEKEYVVELDTRNLVRKKRKEDPLHFIDSLPIMDNIKKKAKKVYINDIEHQEIALKDMAACVFWSVYVATRKLQIPVSLDTIARVTGLGMEKYESNVRGNGLNFGVKLDHKKIGDTVSYFMINGPVVDMTPPTAKDFLLYYIEEQDLEDQKDFIMDFYEKLIKDEFWEDQNPNVLAFAILIFLTNQSKTKTTKKKKEIDIPIYMSKNIIMDLINKLKAEFLTF